MASWLSRLGKPQAGVPATPSTGNSSVAGSSMVPSTFSTPAGAAPKPKPGQTALANLSNLGWNTKPKPKPSTPEVSSAQVSDLEQLYGNEAVPYAGSVQEAAGLPPKEAEPPADEEPPADDGDGTGAGSAPPGASILPNGSENVQAVEAYFNNLLKEDSSNFDQYMGGFARRADIMGNKMGFSIGGGGQSQLAGATIGNAALKFGDRQRQSKLAMIDTVLNQANKDRDYERDINNDYQEFLDSQIAADVPGWQIPSKEEWMVTNGYSEGEDLPDTSGFQKRGNYYTFTDDEGNQSGASIKAIDERATHASNKLGLTAAQMQDDALQSLIKQFLVTKGYSIKSGKIDKNLAELQAFLKENGYNIRLPSSATAPQVNTLNDVTKLE